MKILFLTIFCFAGVIGCQVPQQQIDSGASQAEIEALRADNAALQQQLQTLLMQMRETPDPDNEANSDKEAELAAALAKHLANNPSQRQQFIRDTAAIQSVINDPTATQQEKQAAKKKWWQHPAVARVAGKVFNWGWDKYQDSRSSD